MPMSKARPAWQSQADYSDILYDGAEGIARITINRPARRNAFRPETVRQLIDAFHRAHHDNAIGAIILTGTGSEAFCSGGDQTVRGSEGYIDEGGTPHLNVLDLQMQIRRLPKPVVAMVAGYAIGGGHVLHLVCDLTIAADNARFGQTGPRVGSFDAGLGAGLMARTIGMKRAKEIWLLCRQYDAATALDWGLVNAVVPVDQLEEETVRWCRDMLKLSPMALRMIKAGFNADTDGLAGIQELAGNATGLFYMSEEGQEGRNAWLERRPPDFAKYRRRPLPLRRPWQTSRGNLDERRGSLLRLRTADGLTGWGDCAPLPEFGISEPAARAFAEECAVLDLFAQTADRSLAHWLTGQPAPRSIAVNALLGPLSTVTAEALQAACAAGFTLIKLKAGSAPPDAEAARLAELCANLPPNVRLRLDANGAWRIDEAERFIAACADLPVEGIEEPLRVPDSAALRRLQEGAPFALAIDESIQLVHAAFWRAPPVRRLVLKPARHGGLLPTVALGLRARAAGIECLVSSALESACGLCALAQIAAAIAPDACHGLATAEWFVGDTGHPPRIAEGRLHLPDGTGLGFS
ncbi:UNVERIFIED_CONTAM: hypothetical protein B566_EDAN011656 [Ephemera danica]|nr:hypothetical protein B566_EDAN011656 [Ephemera danica]